jgi:beta-glucosidase
VIVVVISGRPIDLSAVLPNANAVLAAWLPGTEGDGVADVLFGDYRPTGKLSFTWPKFGAGRSTALFPFGFGLTY